VQTQRRWASELEKPGEPQKKKKGEMTTFHAQMFETIQARVEKEKAVQEKASSMQQRTAFGQFWATVFGIHLVQPSSMELIRC
jgi:D-lactate dehydrogenase (cytochrome)